MLFNVESWRQVGAAAGEAGGCLFLAKKIKKDSKKRQKKKNIRHINIKHKKNIERRKCFER